MKKKLISILLAVVCLPMAAQVNVEASIDSMQILIGQQTRVTVTTTSRQDAKVVFPSYRPTEYITSGVEVLNMSDVQMKPIDNGMAHFVRVYTLTSFDDSLYYLPPFSVQVNGKEYKSKSLALKVLTVEVDTIHVEQFYGPREVQDNPFLWSEWSPLFWLSVMMLLLLTLCYYLYLRLRDNKPIISSIKLVKRLLPHQKAMKEIEMIKAEKLVNSENSKEYYTKLTDTLRIYIEERYGFRAMEMTSGEIIERLMATPDQTALEELRQLFSTADLVKFAKYSTLINENDMNLVNAIDFINQTKQENVPVEEPKPQMSEEDQRSQKTRRVLRWTIIVLLSVTVLVLAYVIYGSYQLLS